MHASSPNGIRPRGNKSKAAREFVKDHPKETFEAVYKQLGRLLKAQARRERWKARTERDFQKVLQRLGKSLVGSGDTACDR
jgi:hypothetical protein